MHAFFININPSAFMYFYLRNKGTTIFFERMTTFIFLKLKQNF